MYNPYAPWPTNSTLQYQSQMAMTPQGKQIPRVHGKAGVDSYALGPNESVLLMDETANIVWAKVADAAGYATSRGFYLTPIDNTQEAADVSTVPDYETRLDDIEKKVNSMWEELNGK